MIENLVDKIINKQLEENIIVIEEVNIYRYGYILVCEVFVNIINYCFYYRRDFRKMVVGNFIFDNIHTIKKFLWWMACR